MSTPLSVEDHVAEACRAAHYDHAGLALHTMWGDLPEHRKERWRVIARAALETLQPRVHECVKSAINSVYGTDDRHAYMGLRAAEFALYGKPLPWTWPGTVDLGGS